MKIGIMSDLHLEFDERFAAASGRGAPDGFYGTPSQPSADVLVFAGDIHESLHAFDWVRQHFEGPSVLIAGNHEPYGDELFQSIALNRWKSNYYGNHRVIFLERAVWKCDSAKTHESVRFIGATLWTDFQLYGSADQSMAIAECNLEDYRAIAVERGYKLRTLRPKDTVRLHRVSVDFIRDELRRPFDGATVVVTHHAPSPSSIAAEFKGDSFSPAFASDLEDLIKAYSPTIWVHGHVHHSCDYRIGSTRILCNPRGYFPAELNPSFDPTLVVEI